jgi:predicted HD phosphohydrolase
MMRRLIDVQPSGRRIKPFSKYKAIIKGIHDEELGGIAWHCLNRYNQLGESYYDSYQPFDMFRMTNDFYDFMQEYYDDFLKNEYTDLGTVWKLYDAYCIEANVKNKMQRRTVANELKGYFS